MIQGRFYYEGYEYLLQEKNFTKNTPRLLTPHTEYDGLTLYTQVRNNALVYNIFLTDVKDITKWEGEPGTNPPLGKQVIQFNYIK